MVAQFNINQEYIYKMVILGIHDGHGASAALLIDGKLVAAIAEDRPTRQTTRSGFPFRSIEQCLALGGITAQDVDHVALATFALPPKYFLVPRETFSIADFWREQNEFWGPRIRGEGKPAYLDVFKDRIARDRFIYDDSLFENEEDTKGMLEARLRHLEAFFGLTRAQISVHDHHTCHAYYSFMIHPQRLEKDLLVHTMDGAGDGANGTVWKAKRGEPLIELSRSSMCNIGRMYRYATLLLGMKQFEHAFKTMGMAPYANPKYGKAAYDVYAETLQVDGLGFKYKVKPADNFFHFKEKLEGMRFDGIAWGIQTRTEELLSEWILNGVHASGYKDVALSGGVAMNIKANKVIWELDEVDSLFVPPGAGDESLCIGAAVKAAADNPQCGAERIDRMEPFDTPYLGPSFTAEEVKRRLDDITLPEGCSVRRSSDDELAGILASGEVISRFCGRAEFGQRALGNRSILADPRPRKVVQTINEMIKQRDFWMPFASSVLAERADDYIINPKKISGRFMTIAFDSTAAGAQAMPGALHPYDGTSRPHIVEKSINPGYHSLISAFEKKSGVGALLNTSFNLHGEPIVATPEDAISTFARSGLQHVLIEGWLVSKPKTA
jgi:carbamoyltransferase